MDRKVPKGLFSWSPAGSPEPGGDRTSPLPRSLSFSSLSSDSASSTCTTGSSKVTRSFKFWEVLRFEDGDLRALLGLVATFWAAALSVLDGELSPQNWLWGRAPGWYGASLSRSLLSEVGEGLWPSTDLETLIPKGKRRPAAEVCFLIIRCKLSVLSTLSTMGWGLGLSVLFTGVFLWSSQLAESVSDSLSDLCISCLSLANFSSLFSGKIFFTFLEDAWASWNSKVSFSCIQTFSEISFPNNWRKILSESSSFILARERLEVPKLPRIWIPSWVFNLLFGGDNSSASDGFHWGLPEAGDDGKL